MTIQKDAPESYYEQIKENILNRITSGEYKTDEKIPSERELCELYSVSRTTIRKAIDELVAEGILTRKSGRGTFVIGNNGSEAKKKTGNILFLRCVHSDISKSISEVKDDIFYPKILTGVERASSNNNYHCFYKIINEHDFKEDELEKSIENSDGIVSGEVHNRSFLDFLNKYSQPVVLICPSVKDDRVDVVGIDNLDGAEEAVSYLIEHGHREIAFIGGSEKSISSIERKDGYLRTLKGNCLEINSSLILSYGWRLEDGYNAALDLLNGKVIPTAIFAASDLLAMGVINAIKDFGYKVPDDISVIGFDDIEMAGQVKPSLTTMRVRRLEMGEIAAKLAFERINSERSFPLRISVPTILQERDSVQKRNKV
jgi:DNA-binding LacI/PurR family transcriptional regulator